MSKTNIGQIYGSVANTDIDLSFAFHHLPPSVDHNRSRGGCGGSVCSWTQPGPLCWDYYMLSLDISLIVVVDL